MISTVLTKILLTISNALLVPVMLLLIIFTVTTVLHLGGIVSEVLVRWKHRAPFRKFIDDLKRNPDRQVKVSELPFDHELASRLLPVVSKKTGEKWVDDIHLSMESNLARLHLGIRLGPMLGLAGTLIPLGPALAALATGNTSTFAQNLVVSFTTTVVGLLIGGLCYVMHSIRQRWYMQDMNDIEFIIKRME
jgi:biopolymer transport protein ExbB/TolQ